MALSQQFVDGNQDLNAQERALNFIEQAAFARILNYTKSTGASAPGLTANTAVIQDIPIGEQPGPLHLEALSVNGDATTVITQQLSAGRIVAFHDVAFVSGQEQMILGFR
jgi:hypothetical protein